MQEGVEEMISHHDDNSMDVMDIRWEWTGTYWVRDEHHEALKALREAGMLTATVEMIRLLFVDWNLKSARPMT